MSNSDRMRKIIRFACLLSVFAIPAFPQINVAHLDSIPLSLSSRMSSKLLFEHAQLTWGKPEVASAKKVGENSYRARDAAKDFAANLFVGLFGIGTTTDREMSWMVQGKLECSDNHLTWETEMYGDGELVKEKVREETSEGSKTVSTYRYARIYWDEGVSGYLIENGKPICEFVVFTRPREDSVFFKANYDVFNQPVYNPNFTDKKGARKKFNHDYYMPVNEFAVVGKFKGQEFVLVANELSRNMSFFVNDELLAVYYPSLDGLFARKKYRKPPYLLVNKHISQDELADWYRLVLFGDYLNNTVGQEDMTIKN